jgi:hypothetical protein
MGNVIELKGVNGQLRFDGATVTISRKGLMARGTVGGGDKSIPVAGISAVQLKPAKMGTRGFIAFTIAGGVERTSRVGSQTVDAARDENAVLFKKGQQGEFEAFRDAVQAAIAARATGGGQAGASSVADELGKLMALRDAGALSPEEFEAQKARLLNP